MKLSNFDKNFLPLWFTLIMMIVLSFSHSVKAFDVNGDVFCLAKNIYFEAGNQPEAGRLAVGLVTLNRVDMKQYPDTVCEVVEQGPTMINWKGNVLPIRNKCQFSWFCDGKSDFPEDSKTFEECLIIARLLIEDVVYDFTDSSSHYHNDTVHPYWADHLKRTVTIDNHIFYK